MSCEDVNWRLLVWYKNEIPTLLQHTYLTGTYYVDLAGCGFMLRRCHCTWASLTHAIPVSHGHTRGAFPSVADVRVVYTKHAKNGDFCSKILGYVCRASGAKKKMA